ncbi:MAG: M48 family metallopeptidase [Gemmatimonadales bacterium]
MQAAAGDTVQIQAVPVGAQLRPGVPLDPVAATRAYLATVPPAVQARSHAYTNGGYWLGLGGFLLGAGILLLLLHAGWSRGIRVWAERRTGRAAGRVFLYYVVFTLLVTVLSFPFTMYAGFIRERSYGLATQSFGGWLRDQAVGLAVSLVLGGLGTPVLYAVLRRFPRGWPVIGSVVSMLFLVILVVIAPVFIAPLFNRFTPLEDARIRDPILRLAHANGIAADQVYVQDASRQTTRISAYVSGLLGSERIVLNDNLLRRGSLPEIEAVMGHEMGHYVLGHVYQFLVFFTIVVLAGFAILRRGFAWAVGRWGGRWGVRGVDDPAGLPLLSLILSAYLTVLTPVLNAETRTAEAAADAFGLNAARQPDGFATIALKLADYRKLDPGALEELLLFDHPSGRSRILMAMRWKAAMLDTLAPTPTVPGDRR